jgi:hypothetical protein
MAKVIFVLHRRADMTREQCLEHWSSEQHTSILKTVPGVSRLVQKPRCRRSGRANLRWDRGALV